jgi:hypothetical protein
MKNRKKLVINSNLKPLVRRFDSLHRSGISSNSWHAFKRAFVSAFCSGFKEGLDFSDLKQTQNEKILEFYNRVVTVILKNI